MRVYEVAKEFKIEPEKLIALLRGLGASVRSEASTVDDATVAKLRARMERERRAGHEREEAIEAVIEDATPAKKRRRRKADVEAAKAEAEAEAAEAAVVEPLAEVEPPAVEKAGTRRKKPIFLDDEPAEAQPERATPAADAAESMAAEAAEAADARGEDGSAAAQVEAEAIAAESETVEAEAEAPPAAPEERAPRVPTP